MYITRKKPPYSRHQKGVVLIVSLVFLVALTAVAGALMQNSTLDMKMSGATEQRSIAIQEAVSAVDEVIFNQINSLDNKFTKSTSAAGNFPIGGTDANGKDNVLLSGTKTNATAMIDRLINNNNLPKPCPASLLGDSEDSYDCSFLRITVSRQYGRNNSSVANVDSVVAQQLISLSD